MPGELVHWCLVPGGSDSALTSFFANISFKVRNLLESNDFNLLNIEGNVYGPYTLDGDAADYSSGSSFVRDSVEIADDDIYYPDYDAVVAIHSGPGGESSGNSDDIWSAHWPTLTISTDDEDENGNDHLVDGIKSGASAVLAASIFHYGTYSVNEAKQYLALKDIPVRI